MNSDLDDIADALTGSLPTDGSKGMDSGAQMIADPGSVSAPGIVFTGDIDSGWYRIVANNWGLALNGAKVVDFSTTGIAITGTLTVSGTYDVTGNFSVNTNKFTVAAASGNTAIAGTLSVVGNFAVNTNKFTVDATSGDAAVAGALAVTGAITGASATVTGAVSGATAAGAMVATQAEQETGTATDKLVTPGRQKFHPSAAKAWGKINSSGTLLVGYNVTTAKTSTGVYTITFVVAMSGNDYAVNANTGGGAAQAVSPSTLVAASFRLNNFNFSGALVDGEIHFSVYGDQ